MQRSVESQTSCGSAERPATAWQLKDVQCWLEQQHPQCSKNKKEMLGCMCIYVLVCLSLCVMVIRRGGRRKEAEERHVKSLLRVRFTYSYVCNTVRASPHCERELIVEQNHASAHSVKQNHASAHCERAHCEKRNCCKAPTSCKGTAARLRPAAKAELADLLRSIAPDIHL